MNLQELMNQITTLGSEIRSMAVRLADQATDPTVTMEALEQQQNQLNQKKQRLAALNTAYQAQMADQGQGILPMQGGSAQPAQSRNLADMLRSNEYARAFAYAIQHGISRKNGRDNERVKILYDALTESGGSPTGTDGGFLVPEDIDHTIREVRRSLNPLAELFNEENVTSPTGWRVRDTAPTKGLVDVDEMGQIDDDDDQPAFAKVAYSCTKKALILPVSNELMTDNVANLFAYLGRWFAKKLGISADSVQTKVTSDCSKLLIEELKKRYYRLKVVPSSKLDGLPEESLKLDQRIFIKGKFPEQGVALTDSSGNIYQRHGEAFQRAAPARGELRHHGGRDQRQPRHDHHRPVHRRRQRVCHPVPLRRL